MGGILQTKKYFKTIRWLISKGFEQEKFETDIGEISAYAKLLTHCLHNTNLLQINAVNEEVIKTHAQPMGLMKKPSQR